MIDANIAFYAAVDALIERIRNGSVSANSEPCQVPLPPGIWSPDTICARLHQIYDDHRDGMTNAERQRASTFITESVTDIRRIFRAHGME
jgi:hypothetical protein